VFDNSKISDHFAIIPTLQAPKKLSEAEEKIYDLVVKRFLAVFFPAAEYDVTTRITHVNDEDLKTEGKVLVNPGWMAVYGREGSQEPTLVPVEQGEKVRVDVVELQEKATKPPARYTEATLLSAMEGAGKLVEEDDLREAMAGKGLGTPATRAAIIEGLLLQNYLRREGRDLFPTFKARQLFALLKGLGVSELSEPELTGEWEYKLAQIEQGKMQRDDFMKEIREMTTVIVEAAKRYEGDTVPIENPAHLVNRCPKCGGEIVENYRRFACTSCDFSLSKHPGGRTFEVHEVEELLANREVGPLEGFISKMGRPFAAKLCITDEFKMEFDFGEPQHQDNEPIDFAALEPIGTCPKCGANVYDTEKGYVCEKTQDKACDFRMGKIILQQPISLEQVQKILITGRSDEMSDFVSNRTHRKFSAQLVLGKDGKIGFEFSQTKPVRKTTERFSPKPNKITAHCRIVFETQRIPGSNRSRRPRKHGATAIPIRMANTAPPSNGNMLPIHHAGTAIARQTSTPKSCFLNHVFIQRPPSDVTLTVSHICPQKSSKSRVKTRLNFPCNRGSIDNQTNLNCKSIEVRLKTRLRHNTASVF
jgi:DNA topoisomerase-3